MNYFFLIIHYNEYYFLSFIIHFTFMIMKNTLILDKDTENIFLTLSLIHFFIINMCEMNKMLTYYGTKEVYSFKFDHDYY